MEQAPSPTVVPTPDKGPVLALLPFATLGSDEALFAHGLLEDLASELSRFPLLEVIAPMSSAAVAASPEAVARLGASHILRGNLRRDDARWRLGISLVDTAGGRQIWSDQFEVAGTDFFTMQDEIVARTAASLSARLGDRLLGEARRKPTESLAAWEAVLRGLQELRTGTLEADLAARGFFERALEIDPLCARAHAGLSLSYFNEWSCQFWDRFEEDAARAYAHAHDALDLDDRDPMVHIVIGRILIYRRCFEQAAWYCDRALALCPNDAEALMQLAICDICLGDADAAVEKAEKAMRLNPFHPDHYHPLAGIAYLMRRDFDKAIAAASRSSSAPFVNIPAYEAVALAFAGRIPEGRAKFLEYETLYRTKIRFGAEAAPGEAGRWMLDNAPFRRAEDTALLVEGFRLLDAPCLAAPQPAPDAPVFARAGNGWEIAFGGVRVLVPDMKGLHDIRRLLERPGDEVHCLDLADRVEESYAGDAVLDATARADLKRRIRELGEELAEAEAMNDIGRAEALRSQQDALVEAVAAALGLGGRSRRVGSLTERARSAVTWRIRHAQRRIEAVHPALGRHFANSVRTGTFCRYSPETPVTWRFDAAAPVRRLVV